MVVNDRPLKRMKTRVTADLNDFLTFPTLSNEYTGPFRSNIGSFLSKHARLSPPSSLFSSLLVYQIFFRIGSDPPPASPLSEIVTLDVVEEDVARSSSVYCDQCRVIGWSGHPVCGKRYHFIIRRNCERGNDNWCENCGEFLQSSDLRRVKFGDNVMCRCKACNYEVTPVDLQDWGHLQLEDTTHLLHGVVHSNGYGHLLRVNGREGGSKYLSGCDIMDFWDRMCMNLGARKISVMDVSKKYGLEFRLLHAVTNDHTWYGDWGFEFGAGSFALTLDAYQKAVASLSKIPLSLFFQARKPRTHLQNVISLYQALSERQLTTVRELFCFLMTLLRRTERSLVGSMSKSNKSCSSELCTWTRDDIERVQQSMIKVLQVAGKSCWVSWRALKGSTCRLASSDLLDYCLKMLGGKGLDDGRMVLSRCNPESVAIEYRLGTRFDMSGALLVDGSYKPCKDQILIDLITLYDALLNPYTMASYRPKATRDVAVSSAMKLLDCKQFVKDYESRSAALTNPLTLTFSFQVEIIDQPIDYTSPPPELIYLPLNATIADLKIEAGKALQDVYILFKRFQVEELLGYGEVDASSQVKLLIGSSGSFRVRGRFLFLHGLEQFRMERGVEIWTVSCMCGAKDDDGERMLACDACGIWQHTRCVGLDDHEPVPERFSCFRCISIKQAAKHSKTGGKHISGSRTSTKSKDKTLALSKTGSQAFHLGLESPTQSGISVISNCKEEFLNATQMRSPCKYKYETSDVDALSSKMGSTNPSGTTSDETYAVLDTCSSKIGFAKHAENCYKYSDEFVSPALDTCRTGYGFTVPLPIGDPHIV